MHSLSLLTFYSRVGSNTFWWYNFTYRPIELGLEMIQVQLARLQPPSSVRPTNGLWTHHLPGWECGCYTLYSHPYLWRMATTDVFSGGCFIHSIVCAENPFKSGVRPNFCLTCVRGRVWLPSWGRHFYASHNDVSNSYRFLKGKIMKYILYALIFLRY